MNKEFRATIETYIIAKDEKEARRKIISALVANLPPFSIIDIEERK